MHKPAPCEYLVFLEVEKFQIICAIAKATKNSKAKRQAKSEAIFTLKYVYGAIAETPKK